MKLFLHEQLAQSLLVEIASGYYKNGGRFLSSRKIRHLWNVSATTATRALAHLVELDLIVPQPRSGFRIWPDAQQRALLLLHKRRGNPLPPPETWRSKRHKLRLLDGSRRFRVAIVFDRGTSSGVAMHCRVPQLIISDLDCARAFFKEGIAKNFEIFFYLYAETRSSHEKIVDSLIQNDIDGVALFRRAYSGNVSPVAAPLIQNNIPVVTVFDNCKQVDSLSINLNNIAIGYNAMTTFLGQNHRRLLFVAGIRPNEFIEERLKGFRLALSEANVPNTEMQVLRIPFNRPIPRDRIRGIEKMFLDPSNAPTAIFFPNTVFLRKLLPILKENRRRIPEDISIVGCGSPDLLPEKEFPFDLMAIDFQKIGRVACRSLFHVLTGAPMERSILLDATYLSRGSSRIINPDG